MRPPRVSILGLLAWIALLGVGLAALRSPSPLWAAFIFSVALATLTISVLAAVYRRGRRRAFWVGFATCGWAYFLLTFGPEVTSQFRSELFTTALLEILYPHTVSPTVPAAMAPERSPSTGRVILAGGFGMGPSTPPPSVWSTWTQPQPRAFSRRTPSGAMTTSPGTFQQIGHSLFCLLIALLGGLITRHLHSTRDEPGPVSP